jgi:hypothetical protein
MGEDNFMSKFDYIFKSDGNEMLQLCDDLEKALNKHGLTLITFVDGATVSECYDYDGNILAFFDILEDCKTDK